MTTWQEHTTTFTCSKCHKTITFTSLATTGYGTDKDGNKFCYQCCGQSDLKEMKQKGDIWLYINRREQKVTNWPCSLYFKATIKQGKHNWWMCKRYDAWFRVQGDPYLWHGVNITGGYNDLIHCKRTKTLA